MLETWDGDGVRAVEQAAAVLYAFTASDSERGIRELARSLDISPTTVQRIVRSLERVGLLSFSERTQKYALGMGVLRLAAAFSQQNDLISASGPTMERLWRATRETICLHGCINDRRVTIYQLESPHDVRYSAQVGRDYPLHAGSAGRCLLAFLPEDEIERVLSGTELEPLTVDTITDPARLREELARTRELGYAVSRGECAAGAVGISAPILSAGRLVAALSIYSLELRMTRERVRELAPVLLEATRQIEIQYSRSPRRPSP